ncbi:MAG: hypothetical protein EOM54_04145 [Clostridia bacterium]|nr:hypothetical protein [Clostridia bacterium]
MTGYFGAAAKCGRDLSVKSAECTAGRAARGLISPLRATDTENLKKSTHPGKVRGEKYLLIAEPAAIEDGETEVMVTADGKVYELLRAAPVYVGKNIGHWEGVLRLKGGADDA